ncbi:CASP-like protein 4D1 [Panicum miliaceum]|uniref:CASP-like protein 4D1 n=1 Tax=Panicum miliaceum TaxID=4540 RepID=A0A3L6RRC9_PANMI|nr:CASP-like protein 4D1 [Panicum miliaceum]
MCTDVVVTVLLASGVGAGFGATVNALRKAYVPVVFLLVGMVLSTAATVASARLRARAADDDAADL